MRDFQIISARRAYEYDQDRIRLTLLSSRPVLDFLRNKFSFELAQVATPMETFGPVPATLPPGLVFNYGLFEGEETHQVPIRLFHIEPRRLVIDVSAESASIDEIHREFIHSIQTLQDGEGRTAISGDFTQVNYSEIRAQLDIDPEWLLPKKLSSIYRIRGSFIDSTSNLVPSLSVSLHSDGEFLGRSANLRREFSLELRAGTDPNDRVFYSSAPLNTEEHLDLLEEIERSLSR